MKDKFNPQSYQSLNNIAQHALEWIYKSGTGGLFIKGTKEKLFSSVRCDLLEMSKLSSENEFDQFVDHRLQEVHQNIFELYRPGLKIDPANPFTYTAKLYNQLHKLVVLNYYPFKNGNTDRLYDYLHPVISNQFIDAYLPDLKAVTDIEGWEDYFGIVEYYRYLLQSGLNEETEQLLCLLRGYEV